MTSKPSVKEYHEDAPATDFDEFATVVGSRRSVRRFTDEAIPDDVVDRCLDLALLAPTSSNLQSWEFYRVTSPDKRAALVAACLGQPAAATAAELIVCVARVDTWSRNSADVRRALEDSEWAWPRSMHFYYRVVTRVAYGLGPFSVLAPVKRAAIAATGVVRPIPRGPASRTDRETWSVKTSALACENLMLAFRAAGYDSCAMEGMDEKRVLSILGLGSGALVTMVVGAGRRAKGGVYGPRIRLPRERFVKTV